MTDPCSKETELNALDSTNKAIMEILWKLEKKIDAIHKWLFEWEMGAKYISKDYFDLTIQMLKQQIKDKEYEVAELKANQNKIARIIISAVILAVLGWVIVPKVF